MAWNLCYETLFLIVEKRFSKKPLFYETIKGSFRVYIGRSFLWFGKIFFLVYKHNVLFHLIFNIDLLLKSKNWDLTNWFLSRVYTSWFIFIGIPIVTLENRMVWFFSRFTDLWFKMILIIIEHNFSKVNKSQNNLKENVNVTFTIHVDSIIEIHWDANVLIPMGTLFLSCSLMMKKKIFLFAFCLNKKKNNLWCCLHVVSI